MLNKSDSLRARVAPNDAVRFKYRRRMLEGVVVRTNPKRALVRVDGTEYAVPYERLVVESADGTERERRAEAVQLLALELMQRHGLGDWRFTFDHSARRAGCCIYRDRAIALSLSLATSGSEEDIRDTILHEIAHALVGKRHGHGAIWKSKALEIGCSGTRAHRFELAPPRYHVTCENRCWKQTAQRQNQRLVCRKCGGKLVYSPFLAAARLWSK